MEVPGFKVKRSIGKGGMATAYLAEQESLGREIVLKTLSRSRGKSSDFLNRFENEGRIVASLRHPHIVTIYDIGRAADVVYLAMEYLEGGDLQSRLGEPLMPELALALAADVAQALAYAHRHSVVHRDVKPANILFRGDGTLVLSDFGIAKQVAADSGLTSTGTILGSPYYMSPEQAEGLGIDGRTDIYALGVIFYEMLTGSRPYDADTPVKVLVQHIQEPVPVLPSRLREYQSILNRMMAKKREERIADAGELERELRALRERLLGANTVLATARRSGKPVQPPHRRLWMTVAAGVAAGAVIGGGLYGYAESLAKPSIRRDPSAAGSTVSSPIRPGAAATAGSGVARGAVDNATVVKALEWLARHSIQEERLMHPPADNAYYYYSRLLAMDNGNEAALQGFKDIAEAFARLAEEAYAQRRYGDAQGYIALGLEVNPENEVLSNLRTFIERRERSFIDSLIAFLRS